MQIILVSYLDFPRPDFISQPSFVHGCEINLGKESLGTRLDLPSSTPDSPPTRNSSCSRQRSRSSGRSKLLNVCPQLPSHHYLPPAPSIVAVLQQVEELCRNYAIPLAFADGEK